MEKENPEDGKLQVKLSKKSIVKASNVLAERHQKITLSNLDLLSGRFPVTYLYLYPNRGLMHNNFSSRVESLKISLAQTLNYYYPFAGRIMEDPDSGEPLIICDNTGALLVEARANIPLSKLDFYNFDDSLRGKLVLSVNSDFPTQVQVTHYACGGVSITFTFDHALGDATAFGNFLSSWSQLAQNLPLSCSPDHRRNRIRPRLPPTYHPSLDQTFVKCTLEEIRNVPKTNIQLKRLYYVDASSIDKLQSLACEAQGEKQRTKIEAFSAYIWKVMVSSIDKSQVKCKMGWLVDGRGRLNIIGSNYIGNALSVAIEEASIAEIKQGSIAEIANKVHEAIAKVGDEAHFLDLIDWIEWHKPGLMLSRVVLGREGPALVLSSGRRFPVAELDFGFGSPELGTVSSIIENSGVGYMNQRPSASSDGSWIISAILWPELAAALESDSIFQPLRASHLQI